MDRARMQASGRISLMGQLFGQTQDFVTVGNFSASLVVYGSWLIALLAITLVPSFLSDYKGTALMLDAYPPPPVLIANEVTTPTGSARRCACIPGRAGRTRPIRHGKHLYRQRYRIEIMFGQLKEWRRIHARYDRCALPS